MVHILNAHHFKPWAWEFSLAMLIIANVQHKLLATKTLWLSIQMRYTVFQSLTATVDIPSLTTGSNSFGLVDGQQLQQTLQIRSTIEVLQHCHMLNLQGELPGHSFYQAVELQTCNNRLWDVLVSKTYLGSAEHCWSVFG